MPLIEAKKICLGYDGRDIVKNLSFDVNAGNYLCIIGENGSGKSTLIKALLGLKKTSRGHLHFLGVSPKEIGYLPQQTELQKDFPASGFEVVLSGFLGKKGLFGFYSKRDKEEALKNMRMLGVEKLKNECFRDLSGGQRQRLMLCRALCAAKSLILLDEPVTGLDPSASEEMYSLLEKINKSHGITVIMVSHDTSAALKYASHILHLSQSDETTFFGTKEEYLKSGRGWAFSGGNAQ